MCVRRMRTAGLLACAPVLAALGIAPAAAVESPLSRAAFERAVEQGRSCKNFKKVGPYVVVKRGTEPLVATIFDDLMQHYFDDEITQSFVTIRLDTPFTRARRAACDAMLLNGPFDEVAAWEKAGTSGIVTIYVETRTLSTKNDDLSRANQAYGVPPETERKEGPRVIGVALRRGEGDGASLVEPISVGIGTEYEFPATALQGKGPFFLIIRTEAPEGQLTMRL